MSPTALAAFTITTFNKRGFGPTTNPKQEGLTMIRDGAIFLNQTEMEKDMTQQQKIGDGEAIHNTPAVRISLRDVVDEYDAKHAAIPETIQTFHKAWDAAQSGACIGGTYGGTIHSGHIGLHHRTVEAVLLVSAWKNVYAGLQVEKVASAKDRKQFELFFTKPDAFTILNLRDRFGDYLISPRWHILKGLAECFTDLDPAYKSHDKVKIGVKGLPKRIIVENCGESYGWGYDKAKDVLNALNVYRDNPRIDNSEFSELMKSARNDEPEYCGVRIKKYMNGNAHMIFDAQTLLDINRALAEFYGEVLADSPEEQAEQKKRTGTAVLADLAYYPTPQAAIDELLYDTALRPDMAVLEPSCGTGGIIAAILKKQPTARVTGIEVHGGRWNEAKDRGFHVMRENFLHVAPQATFDRVFMNPPFAGKHYQKHVDHAKRFLKPGGILKAILPATAYYDHGFCGKVTGRWSYCWQDLPVGSFKESGTGVPTGIYTYQAPK